MKLSHAVQIIVPIILLFFPFKYLYIACLIIFFINSIITAYLLDNSDDAKEISISMAITTIVTLATQAIIIFELYHTILRASIWYIIAHILICVWDAMFYSYIFGTYNDWRNK